MTMADTIAVMNRGRVERMGEPIEIYDDPRTAFVASFLGASNLMDGQVDGDTVALSGGDRVHVMPGRLPASGAVSIGVRPEKIHLTEFGTDARHPNKVEGVITDASFIGVSTHYLVKTASAGELTVVVQNLDGFRHGPGTSVTMSWEPEHTFVVSS